MSTVEVKITRTADRVIVTAPGVSEVLGPWATMCVPDGPNGERRSGAATKVPDEVVLEALFGDQHIYSTEPAPEVDVVALGERRYRVTVKR